MTITQGISKPYKLGIALSGGGARGFAHVGALKAIEEYGLKPDVIAGVSAGSVIAVLYSAGVSADKIMSMFSNMKFRDFCDFRIRGGGFFRIDKFRKFVMEQIGPQYKNIEDLPIPVVMGTTDIDHGCPVAFDKGPIGDAMIASCSIPILFQPVVIDGVRYVDGGVLRNMPSWIIRDKCEKLIGINCSPISTVTVKNTVFDIGLRSYHLMSKANVREDMELCDLGISIPEIAVYSTFNLKEIKQVYIRGYAAAKQALKNAAPIIAKTANPNEK